MAYKIVAATFIVLGGTTLPTIQGGTTDYTSRSAFMAATSNITTIGFNGIIPAGTQFKAFNVLTVAGVSFSTATAVVDVTTANYYAPRYPPYIADFIVDSQNPSLNNQLLIKFMQPAYSVALDYGGLGFSGPGFGTITLSNGHTFTRPLASEGNTQFVGFVSTDPITSVTLLAVNDNWVVLDVLFGAPKHITLTLEQPTVAPSDSTPLSVPKVVNTLSASVLLVDGAGMPVSNALVDFKGQPVSLADGGHNHSDISSLTADFFTDGFSAVNSCTTLSDGTCQLIYVVPIASGSFKLSAWLDSDGSVSDDKPLTVQVPDLVPLGSGGCPSPFVGNIYTLTGCTATHQSSNHYGTPVMVRKVAALASTYYASISVAGSILDINDMSLPLGGIFDICIFGSELGCTGASPWNRPHNLHRNGESVDINHTHRDGTKVKEVLLERIAKQLGLRKVIEPNIHYELH